MKRAMLTSTACLLALPSTASAWCRTTTDQTPAASPTTCVTTGIPLRWTRQCQTFSLDSAAGGGLGLEPVRTAVTSAFGAWNAVTCAAGPMFSVTPTIDITCDRAEYSSNDGNSNTIAFTSDFAARMYPDDAIAVTVVWHDTDTGVIYDADMLLNEQMGPFVNCGVACAPTETHFDLRNVVTHEAGHFLGLAHSADVAATMYFRADVGETLKRTLAQDDIDGICDIYGGATVPAECDPTPRHGFDSNCNVEPSGRKGCGCDLPGASRGPRSLAATALLAFAALGGLLSFRRRLRRES